MADSTGYSPADSRFHQWQISQVMVPLIAGSTGGKIPQVSGPLDAAGVVFISPSPI